MSETRTKRSMRTMLKKVLSLTLTVMMTFSLMSGMLMNTASAASSVGPQMLMRGYNLFGGKELSNENTKGGIFKSTAGTVLADLYTFVNVSRTDSYAIVAKSFSELQEKVNDKFGLSQSMGLSVNAAVWSMKANMSAKYSRESKNDYKTSVDTRFFEMGVIRQEGVIAFDNWSAPATQQRVKAELDDNFLSRLKNENNIELLFKDYGTHIITAYNMGGTAGMKSSVVEKKKATDAKTKSDYDLSVEVNVKAFTVQGEAKTAVNYMQDVNKLTNDSSFDAQSKGFAYGGRGYITLSDNVDNVNKSFQDWIATLKPSEGTCTMLIDSQLQLVPIWELLPDGNETRKKALQDRFQTLLIEFDSTFNNEFIYKAAMSGDASASVEVHSSGVPTVNTSGKIEISKANQFINIGTSQYPANGNYVLTANLDLGGQTRFESMTTPFTGSFDGNGYTICNFNMEVAPSALTANVGLFGQNSGTIKNLIIRDSSLTVSGGNAGGIGARSWNVGMVAGENSGTIENVQVENSSVVVTHIGDNVNRTNDICLGGIAGHSKAGSTISKCSYASRVQGSGLLLNLNMKNVLSADAKVNIWTGGIAGRSYGSMRDCYSDTPVNFVPEFVTLTGPSSDATLVLLSAQLAAQMKATNSSAGGIAGTLGTTGTLQRCFAVGTVSAYSSNDYSMYKGQLIGSILGGTTTVKDCYILDGKTAVGSGTASGINSVSSYKNAAMTTLLAANGWVDLPSYNYPRLPGTTYKFDIYYKSGIPKYEQCYVFPTNLSSHMSVYFGGIKNITDEVQLRYDFNTTGTKKVQVTYQDPSGSIFTGDFDATVISAESGYQPDSLDSSGRTSTGRVGLFDKTAGFDKPATGRVTETDKPPTTTPPPTPNQSDFDVATTGNLNGIVLMATTTDVGIKFNWTPSNSSLGYRIYRSTVPGQEGISISDFPIVGSKFVDVNVKPDIQYYYTIRKVEAEASLDRITFEVIDEKVGTVGETLSVKTAEIVTKDVARQFILMQVSKDTMLVNENIEEIDPGRGTTPVVLDSRTLVPIRAIIETMKGTIDWNGDTQEITLEAYGHTVKMTLDSNTIVVDGVTKEIDVPSTTINGRTMVPVRFVAENIGCNIQWVGSTQEIIIVFYS